MMPGKDNVSPKVSNAAKHRERGTDIDIIDTKGNKINPAFEFMGYIIFFGFSVGFVFGSVIAFFFWISRGAGL